MHTSHMRTRWHLIYLGVITLYVLLITTVLLSAPAGASTGKWMGWQSYCAAHPHFAHHHKVLCS